ncbi:unnamed protein product [Paramecium octaurelia]|uniref:Uncharacterized protein n=1 Tax=Paramecium octaurelia TaxID=43137 RepID=A0A8S1YHZ1_PAROT|nr:unnamed protein product [Paramecium octaurelia]
MEDPIFKFYSLEDLVPSMMKLKEPYVQENAGLTRRRNLMVSKNYLDKKFSAKELSQRSMESALNTLEQGLHSQNHLNLDCQGRGGKKIKKNLIRYPLEQLDFIGKCNLNSKGSLGQGGDTQAGQILGQRPLGRQWYKMIWISLIMFSI